MLAGLDHDYLVNFAASVVGRRQDAEDIVQDVYVKFLTGKVPAFRGESEHKTWIFAIVKYTALHWKSQEKERREREIQYERLRDTDYTPQYDAWLDAEKALLKLSESDRKILLRYAYHGSLRDLARELGASYVVTKGRVNKARRRLREQMA